MKLPTFASLFAAIQSLFADPKGGKPVPRSRLRATYTLREQVEREAAGIARRLDLHRRSCLTAYEAKAVLVRIGKGHHRFIHPATESLTD